MISYVARWQVENLRRSLSEGHWCQWQNPEEAPQPKGSKTESAAPGAILLEEQQVFQEGCVDLTAMDFR